MTVIGNWRYVLLLCLTGHFIDLVTKIMARWPTYVQLNVYGYDDYFYGDTDGDGVMDRLPPNSAGSLTSAVL